MSDVKFEDYSKEAKNMLEAEIIGWLHDAASEVEAAAIRSTPVGKVNGGNTAQKWKYVVDKAAHKATIGNSEQTAIWLELGTGDYALEGKGRKGGWYILIGEGPGQISQKVVDEYKFDVVYGKDGRKFAYTTGMKPRRMLHNAGEKKKSKIQKLLAARLKKLGD